MFLPFTKYWQSRIYRKIYRKIFNWLICDFLINNGPMSNQSGFKKRDSCLNDFLFAWHEMKSIIWWMSKSATLL